LACVALPEAALKPERGSAACLDVNANRMHATWDRRPMRRYFDNAATSYPKPPAVAQAVQDYFARVHASAGRGAYREALACERILDDCRAALRQLFYCRPDDHVIFTLNGTDALNLAIKGVVRPGDHVVTTCLDHNSVLRPLSALQEQAGVTWTAVPVDHDSTRLDPADLAQALRPQTRLVVVNHASNVTGVLQPLEPIAEICRTREVLLLVDGAQSAGHVPIDFGRLGLDLLACPGHKGLLGPLGTGLFLIRAGVENQMRTVREGGTGSHSERPIQPPTLPDRFEAGSHNAVGLAGLLAAVTWINERTVAALREHEVTLCRHLSARLDEIEGLWWFGPRRAEDRVGVFSVRLEGVEPQELSALLESEYGVLTRSGLHCAPLAHRTLGTLEKGGTTRLSLGPFTTLADVEAACAGLAELARHATRVRRIVQPSNAAGL
jgi:cysteine desulfurase/selenocysteine lyase